MASSEFIAMTALHNAIPDATAAPIAWGTYASNPNIHFLLCDFLDMTDDVPDVEAFAAKISELHMNATSPNGKYGFDVPTHLGYLAQYTVWKDSWEEFFTHHLKHLMSVVEYQEGHDPEMAKLFDQIVNKVIPRLLRPLETGGRQIKPCLVHGDLYPGNVSVDNVTGVPLIYDAPCLYAHHECESRSNRYHLGRAKETGDMAQWSLPQHKIGAPFVKAYFRHFPVSAPEEDEPDRRILYSL
jgi:fructosamine-3-kinase